MTDSPSVVPRIPWSWGATVDERRRAYPCDDLLPDADVAMFRAVSVSAPRTEVFRWLCQLRVAPYSYDWIDNGFRRSPTGLDPALQQLEVGQTFMSIFKLTSYETDRHLTLRIFRRRAITLFGELAVTYAVTGDASHSRLAAKLLVRSGSGRLRSAKRWLLAWGDLIMMRRQLLTLKGLAEG